MKGGVSHSASQVHQITQTQTHRKGTCVAFSPPRMLPRLLASESFWMTWPKASRLLLM